jgi:hypothetical protein
VQLRDQAIQTAALSIREGNPRLALAATREAMRSSLEIDRLQERTAARAAAAGPKMRQVVLYLPERRPSRG